MAGNKKDEDNRSKASGPRPFTGRNPNNVEDSRRFLPKPNDKTSGKLPELKKKKKSMKTAPNYQELARKRVTGQI